jgi:hypothetical protein
MKRLILLLLAASIHSIALAEELEFSQAQTVTSASGGVFLHLDPSGRRSIAISGGTVAVVWEDNRGGKPAIYLASRMTGDNTFSAPRKISKQLPAYEPVIAALSDGRFLIGWEEDKQVWLRVVSPDKSGPALRLGDMRSQQVSIATNTRGKAIAVWSQGNKQKFYIYTTDLHIDGHHIQTTAPRLVDSSNDKSKQLYPVIALSKQGSVVAWEDRRQGATRIFSAFAPNDKPFLPYQVINEFKSSPNRKYGKGSGAMRPALASNHEQLIIAAWMDKRNWRSGYDVYTAPSSNGGEEFGKNEQAQDMFAENIPQWHATVALRAQDDVAAVAWDDTRNDNPDVFYSLRINGQWSDDYELPGATGPGRQSNPSLTFDDDGVLHAVWLNTADGQSSLQYTHSLPPQ